MKITYEKGYEDGGEWILEESKTEIVRNMPVIDLVNRLKAFIDKHPDAYIQADSRLYVFDYVNGGYSLDFEAQGDETE